MVRNLLAVMLMMCGCLKAAGEEKVLATFPADELPPLAATAGNQPGVTTTLDQTISADGKGSIKITYSRSDDVEVILFPKELSGIDNCVLWYEAAMKSEGTARKAYLAMWVNFPDGNRYFSRGLDQAFNGTQDWRRCRIPFFLKKGQVPVSVDMGVRFEGPGTVWLDDVRLVQDTQGSSNLGGISATSEGKVLATFPADELPPLAATAGNQAGVTTTLDQAISADGKGSIKITYSRNDDVEIILFPKELSGIDNSILWYEAAMKSEGTARKAYLAMWVNFPDGNRYFSRGLDQAFNGTQDWRRCKIPFLLKKGQVPVSVDMGVRFEGPGTVWLDDVRLVQDTQGTSDFGGVTGTAVRRICALYGGVVGIWGGIAGVLGSRGKGRRFALIPGLCFLAIGFFVLAAGIYFQVSGNSRDVYHPLLLTGIVDVVVLAPVLAFIMRAYKRAEAQRLEALDQAENL